MIYSLDINIICNNQGIITAIKNNIPINGTNGVINDLKLNKGIFEKEDIDNNKELITMVRFNLKSDRDNLSAIIRGLNGLITAISGGQCLDGSVINHVNCYHDENPSKPCEITETYK